MAEVPRPAVLTRDYVESQFIRRSMPAVLRGLVADWPARRWDFERLEEYFPRRKIRICAATNTDGLSVTGTQVESEEIARQLTGTSRDVNGLRPDWLLDVVRDLPELLPEFPPLNVHRGQFDYHIFMGRDTRTRGHYHPYQHAIICQIHGRKRVLLYPPEDAPFLYAYPERSSPHFHTSRVDFEDPDFGEFPLARRTHLYETVLEPGDALFLPVHWWHGVYGMGPVMSTSLFWNARWREHKLAHIRLEDVAGALGGYTWPRIREKVASLRHRARRGLG